MKPLLNRTPSLLKGSFDISWSTYLGLCVNNLTNSSYLSVFEGDWGPSVTRLVSSGPFGSSLLPPHKRPCSSVWVESDSSDIGKLRSPVGFGKNPPNIDNGRSTVLLVG